MNSTIKAAAKFAEELNQSKQNSDTLKEGIQNTKAELGESLKKKWKSKLMHCQHIRSMDRQLISEEDTFLWLSRRELKGETESEIIAARDQTLQTKYHAT
jgi:hypothetical protein